MNAEKTERVIAAATDAEEITRAVREEAARHEQLHERLSRVVGPVADYETMSLPELAEYGLKKLGLKVDATDDPRVVALEHALRGRSGREMGGGAGLDSAGGRDSFMDRYLST